MTPGGCLSENSDMFVERTSRKLLRFDLNNPADLEEYNKHLQNPSVRIINKDVMQQTESHFEKDYSTTSTHHIAYLEVEECTF